MGKKEIIEDSESTRYIYSVVLLFGWEISNKRIRKNGDYVVKLTKAKHPKDYPVPMPGEISYRILNQQ